MNRLFAMFAATTLVLSFQNCNKVKFEDAKLVSKISDNGTEATLPDDDSDSGDDTAGNPGQNPNVPGGTDDENHDYTDEELAAAACSDGDEEGYLICHFPPGNWEAFHTICIGKPALQAHLNHAHSDTPGHPQDLLGSCEDNF